MTTKQIQLFWEDNSGNEVGFRVERSDGDSTGDGVPDNWAQLGADTGSGVTEFLDTGASPGEDYFYSVRAVYTATPAPAGVTSSASAMTSATTPVFAPSDPSGVTATPLAPAYENGNWVHKVRVGWQDNSDDESAFEVASIGAAATYSRGDTYVSSATESSGTGMRTIDVPLPNSYLFLGSPTEYQFRVRARSASDAGGGGYLYSGYADPPAGVRTQTQPGGDAPAAVSDLTHQPLSGDGSSVSLSWTNPTTGSAALVVEIEATPASGGGRTARMTYGPGTTGEPMLLFPEPNMAYGIVVRRYNAHGYSSAASLSVTSGNFVAPTAASGLAATAVSTSRINVSWTGTPNWSSRRVEVSDEPLFSSQIVPIFEDDGASSPIGVTGLAADTTYYFRMYAYAGNQYRYSEVVQATTAALPASVQVRVIDPKAGEAGPNPGRFVFERVGGGSGRTSLPITYTVSDASGSAATPGSDYGALSGSVTIPAYGAAAVVTVGPANNTTSEWTEDVTITGQDAAGYTVSSPRSAIIEIVDDDGVTLSVASIIRTNNDDDNDDGRPDSDETGYVSGEDDLLPLDIAFPQDVKQGARVTLSATTDRAKVWLDPSKSQVLLAGTTSSHTWTVGAGTIPTRLWVEGLGASSIVGDIVFTVAATDANAIPAPQHITSSADQQNSSGLTLTLYRRDQEDKNLHGKTTPVMVGEYIGVGIRAESAEGLEPTFYRWTVDGAAGNDAIKDYTVSRGEAKVTLLSPADLEGATRDFTYMYWIDADPTNPSPENVSVDVTVGGEIHTAMTTFEVHRPSATLTGTITANNPTVSVGWAGFPNEDFDTLHLGTNEEGKYGITWDGEVTTPAHGAGTIRFSQRTIVDQHFVEDDDSRWRFTSNGAWVHDDPTPYGGVTKPLLGNDTKPITSNDSPSDTVVGYKSISVNDSYELNLMYKPVGERSIWVTLRRLDWNWKASATKGATWAVAPGSEPSTPGARIESVDVSVLPEWTAYRSGILEFRE